MRSKNSNRKIEDIWQPIEDVDMTKRFPEEWARINGISIINCTKNELMNEYEFAYWLPSWNYVPVKKTADGIMDFDSIAEREMRLTYIRRDIFMGADYGERLMLNDNYVETVWIRNNDLRI